MNLITKDLFLNIINIKDFGLFKNIFTILHLFLNLKRTLNYSSPQKKRHSLKLKKNNRNNHKFCSKVIKPNKPIIKTKIKKKLSLIILIKKLKLFVLQSKKSSRYSKSIKLKILAKRELKDTPNF